MFLAALCLDGGWEPPGRTPAGCVPLSILSLLLPVQRHSGAVKSLVRWIAFVLLSGLAVFPAQAAFSSLYAFGDGACTTTDNSRRRQITTPTPIPMAGFGSRCWRSGKDVTYDASKNLSYFYHLSSDLADGYSAGSPRQMRDTSLFVIWVNDADFVDDMTYFYPDHLDTDHMEHCHQYFDRQPSNGHPNPLCQRRPHLDHAERRGHYQDPAVFRHYVFRRKEFHSRKDRLFQHQFCHHVESGKRRRCPA